MHIVFFGNGDFGVHSLEILHKHYSIACVVTNPDKPAGRGRKLSFTPIKEKANSLQLPVIQPESLKDPQFIENLKNLSADIFVVVAFRILPPEVFRLAKFGSFNLHASLLPKYRGAAPIHWAIINGEVETGVTTFFLEETVDTGKIILQARTPIHDDETAGELHDRLSLIGAELVLHTVRLIELGKVKPTPQDNALATPAPKIMVDHCRINWAQPSNRVHNFIRGLSPKPGAFTFHNNNLFKIYRTKVVDFKYSGEVGQLHTQGNRLFVLTGDGAVEILELQKEGKRVLSADEFLRGYRFKDGDRFS